MNAGTQLIAISTPAHIYAIFLLILIIGYNYYVVHTYDKFILMAQRLKKLTPIYHGVNFIIAYLGIVLAAFTHDISPTVILMIPTSLFLMISEIKRYKKMRVITLEDIQLQIEFKKFAKKIYTMQLSIIVLIYLVAKIF